MTGEEQNAIVDEAHRQGVRVACTAHASVAVRQLQPNHVGRGGGGLPSSSRSAGVTAFGKSWARSSIRTSGKDFRSVT
jgi:hypothetical protein